ncbi:glycosyltransferase family 9 protein [Streptomyces sp. NPDC056149]|uniref:glycosyltransferase family 9 protein n=1 Tax=unclassified Streptomyces TaxID=2593676 RepID=UPI00238122D0|nr:glycosyltransferase family 9 protein [Streptomyces sp. WZ-12]
MAVDGVCVLARLVEPGLGDLVQRNIALALLRRAFPTARLTMVTGSTVAGRFAEFFARHSYATDVLECPDPGDPDPDRWARFHAQLAALGARVCFVDPDSRGLGAPEARRAGIPVRLGLSGPGTAPGDLTDPLRLPPPLLGRADLFDHASALAATLGLTGGLRPGAVVPPLPRTGQPPPDLPVGVPRLAVHPGGAPHWNRRWPPDRYAELCRRAIGQHGAVCYLLGTGEERADLLALAGAITAGRPTAAVEVVTGRSLDRTANLLAEMDLLVGNDSALAHIAAAVRLPTVVLYGPTGTQFLWARIYPHHHGVSLRYPCQSATHRPDELAGRRCAHDCPIPYSSAAGRYPRCLSDIGVDQVWAVASRLLGTATSEPGKAEVSGAH